MEDFSDFMVSLLPFMQDTLTIQLLTPGSVDDQTGAPTGTGTAQTVITQPCSDQDLDARSRAQLIVNGVAGSIPVSRCFTAWFPWPDVPAGAELVVRVNGRLRPLLKQGPPTDSAGQHGVYVLELGAPEGGR